MIIHGSESYFGDEVIKKEEQRKVNMRKSQEKLEKVKKEALFYSRMRKLFWGGSFAILMYILYQKFYATAQ